MQVPYARMFLLGERAFERPSSDCFGSWINFLESEQHCGDIVSHMIEKLPLHIQINDCVVYISICIYVYYIYIHTHTHMSTYDIIEDLTSNFLPV